MLKYPWKLPLWNTNWLILQSDLFIKVKSTAVYTFEWGRETWNFTAEKWNNEPNKYELTCKTYRNSQDDKRHTHIFRFFFNFTLKFFVLLKIHIQVILYVQFIETIS